MESKNIRNELKEIAPELGKLQGSNPFGVPEDFFDQLPQMIAVKTRVRPTTFGQILFPVLRPVALAAAMLAVVFSALFFLNQSENGDLLSDHDLLMFEEYLAWYSDYPSEVYLDRVLEEPAKEEVFQNDDFIIDYILDYHGDGIADLLD